MPKIAYQYEYQTDMKDIGLTPHKRSAVWGKQGRKGKKRSVGATTTITNKVRYDNIRPNQSGSNEAQ